MSIEYTIDIQLTELGFPEIVPRNSSGRETGSQSIPASQKQKVQPADGAKGAARCKSAHPSEGVQDAQVKGRTGGSPAGTVDTAAPTAGQRDAGHAAELDDDSDDSDVSDVCEEEEVDDNVDVDGLHNGGPQRSPDIFRGK